MIYETDAMLYITNI